MRAQCRRKHNGNDRHQLHENVERGTRGVLERVTNSVTNDRSTMALSALAAKRTSLDELLGVVPSATGVGGRNGHLHRRNERADKHARKSLDTEEEANNERGEHDKRTRRKHLLERRIGRDLDAAAVVGGRCALHEALDRAELLAHLLDHRHRGLADRLHGHRREPVRKHCAVQETSKGERVENVDVEVGGAGLLGGRDERSEKRKGHKRSRANRETLADGRSGVTGGIESIGLLADLGTHARHLRNTTGIVRDRAVGVNGETSREGGENAECCDGHAVDGGKAVADIDGDAETAHGDDAALVAERQAVDDHCCCACVGRLCDLLHRGVRV
eukprot:comp22108_c0_seq4/m.51444 comp22108_c0_seq4/g.51444  ORF comp22108_c0_seq4/g.51444 comp22108_c0_seq4/m.51444 type:complete len:331 (-) comp22108_c0_seq4:137-1129(-)